MTAHPIFFKLDVNFTEHPRTLELSDPAFRSLMELWAYCKRLNTDGIVPLTRWKSVRITSQKQLLRHYVKDHGTHVEMVGWLEHQQSAEQLADLRKRRAEYGRLGGLAKAHGKQDAKQTAKQTAKQNSSHIDIDIEKELKDFGASPLPRRAVALPKDFKITEAMTKWAGENCPGVDVTLQTENFKDWHTAKGSTFKDWAAAWRTWMRKSNPTPQAVAAAAHPKEWWHHS